MVEALRASGIEVTYIAEMEPGVSDDVVRARRSRTSTPSVGLSQLRSHWASQPVLLYARRGCLHLWVSGLARIDRQEPLS
ncbi:MAG: hypothetical protein ACREVY_01250 [Gammaproteobacteria bacterium]